MKLVPLLLFLHLIAVAVWVGGMFFAYLCLRPVAAAQLEPPQRLALWAGVFERFFPWVWLAVALILGSGLDMFAIIGGRNWQDVPLHWNLMMGTGIIMMLIFAHLYFAPFQTLRQCVAAADWPRAGAALNQIRKLVGFNLALGLITIAVATLGIYI
ncbi:MAG TPA: DUF4149 domain-containing protein [Rhodocyclaceae bacterium]|nr:DUF4149 domain-containing protein [Rhodocyclaceae bacterium]